MSTQCPILDIRHWPTQENISYEKETYRANASNQCHNLSFNPLYSDRFSHAEKYNKDGIVHAIFQGVTGHAGRNFQILKYVQ